MIKELWTVYKILRWNKKNFPNITSEDQAKKLFGETKEWEEALDILEKDKKHRKVKKMEADLECADVIIASIGCLRFSKHLSTVNSKMFVNYHRIFVNGQHVNKRKK